jgi:aspartyl/asparaginyl beta-hydroxylase (cupin superfamily)
VCVCVQQNILNEENKRDKIFVDEVETQWREKPFLGSQTHNIHYTEDKANYETLVLIYL